MTADRDALATRSRRGSTRSRLPRGQLPSGRSPVAAKRPPRLRKWLLLLALPLLAGLAGPHIAERIPLDIGELGDCPAAPTDVFVVADVSSSVVGPGGADTRGRTFDEAQILAERLAQQGCNPADSFTVVTFASSSSVDGPHVLSAGSPQIDQPPEALVGGGSNLSSGLEPVVARVRLALGHQAIVIVLSDMAVDVSTSEFASLLDAGAELHLVALGSSYDPQFDRYFSTVKEIRFARRGDVATSLADAIRSTRSEQGSQP